MDKPILFTGIRPTGFLHLGHFYSIIKPILKNMNNYDVYVMIADLHALNELRNIEDYILLEADIEMYTYECVDTLTRFIDPEKLTIFKQSDLKRYHLDLFYKLLMISKHSNTFGNPIFKDMIRNEYLNDIELLKLDNTIKELLNEFIVETDEILWGNITDSIFSKLMQLALKADYTNFTMDSIRRVVKYLNTKQGVIGLATYPILMTADILLYQPDVVLVGSDQLPHIQIANELVRNINNNFGFMNRLEKIIPLIDSTETVKGLDGKKMSKTLQNYISISDLIDTDVYSNNKTLQWFNKIKTYSRSRNECGKPDECLVDEFHKLLNGINLYNHLCIEGNVGCVECKTSLHNIFRIYINGLVRYNNDDKDIDIILQNGKEKALKRMMKNPIIVKLLN